MVTKMRSEIRSECMSQFKFGGSTLPTSIRYEHFSNDGILPRSGRNRLEMHEKGHEVLICARCMKSEFCSIFT